jgi:hypothetical protein
MHAQNPGELAAQAAHPALQPVAAVLGYKLGNRFHKAGAVLANDGHNERNLHAQSVEPDRRRDKSFCGSAG